MMQTVRAGSLTILENREDLRFILFGGKGGVGKTTCSAATAIHLARAMPHRKILILSTDPAPSLPDSFELRIGDRVTPIPGLSNLYAWEMNAENEYKRFKKQYVDEIRKAFDESALMNVGLGMDYERRTMEELMEQAPPGLDEMMSLTNIVDLTQEGRYGIILLDTAPTGHLLKLLEMPQLMGEWVSILVRIQLKYKKVIHLCRVVILLLEQKKKILDTQEILLDPERTAFVTLTIP